MPPKKGFKYTEESRRINSEAKTGDKNPMWGRKHTEEWKKRMSELQKGKPKSPETIQRMKEAHKNDPGPPKGRKRSPEACKNISKGRMGMKFSEEHLKNLSISHKGQKVSKEGRHKRSVYNKTHPEVIDRLRRIRTKRPSKPQLELFEVIKKLYPDNHVELEWEVKTTAGSRYIDVAIPELMRGYEYDSPAYHGLFRGSKENDAIRHKLIENEGWKLVHYSDTSEFPKI